MKSKRKVVRYKETENLWSIYIHINLQKLQLNNTFNSLSNNMHPGSGNIQAEHALSYLLSHIIR